MKRKLEEAFRSLPRADVRLGDTGLNADLDRLRARLAALSGKTIGLDIDAGAALAEITDIDARLRRLAAESPDVQVRTDTAAARAALAAVQAQINGIDGDDIHVDVHVDTAGAMAALRALGIALGGVAAIPVIPVAAAGIGAIASAAVAAGAGVGVLALAAVPAIKGVTSVMQLKTQADKESAKATDNSAAANVRAAQSALQMASAQQALTAAHRNAARSIAQANRQVEDAERAVAQAVQRAADQRLQSAENVERAEQSLADAHRGVQRAEQSLADAHRGVQRAEQSLADAQRQSTQAQEDLTQARADAAQQLADLNDQLERGKLDERDATLRVKEAQEELNRTQLEYDAGRATDLQMERAQLAYDQSVQAAQQQKKDNAQLQKDAEAARKAGVDGNDAVKQAADRVADAQRNVKDQTQAVADAQRGVQDQTQAVADAQRNVLDQAQAVADAQRDAARAQVESAQSVADAQRSLSDAVSNAANTQVQAAESITSAERGVESARLSSINTTAKAATKADEYRKALAKLTPSQRDLYDSIAGPQGLTKAFKDWSLSLQPDVLPLFTRGVDGMKNSLPGLSPLVKTAADAVGDLMDRASADLKKPFWQDFKKDIQTSAKPAIVGLGRTIGNVLKGAAGTIDAFLPHIDGIVDRMVKSSGRFANWGAKLKGSPEFENFLKYADEHGPLIAKTLGSIAGAFLAIGSALSPISGPLLRVIGAVADGIASVADTLPWLVQGLYAAFVITKLWTVAQAALNLVMDANPIVLIGVALVALVATVIYAYRHWGWFHDVVQAAWRGIQAAALWAWTNVLKPVFGFISAALKAVGDVAVWLWDHAISPAFSFISTAARVLFAILVTAVLTPIVLAIKAVGAIAMWLWTDSFKPSFENIAALAQWLWAKVLHPVFGWIWGGIKWVGDKFVWLYNNAVAPTARWIADKAKWLWDKALSPVFRFIWNGLKWVGDKFAWLYDHGVKPPLHAIAEVASWLYDKALKPAFDNIKSAVRLVADAFESAKNMMKSAWNAVASVASKPINWVVDFVYTKGIKAVWDKVADFVGLDPLPDAPKLLEAPKKFAVGGRTSGGTPGVDSIPALLMADEFVIRRDSARKIGFGALEHINRTGELPGVRKFAGGGIVGALGDAWDWTKDTVGGAVSKGVDWAKTAGDLIANPSKILAKLMKPILDSVRGHLDVGGLGGMLAKFPAKMVSGLKDKIVDALTSSGSSGGGGNIGGTIPTGRRKTIISQAMAAAHVPPPGTVAQWLSGMNTLITRESGWNPNAINLWDSNARAGHPSQGLTQTIPGTFNAYVPSALKSRGILDPVANVAASIRYIVSRYGNISNVQQANANMPPAGYAIGGRVTPTWYDDGGMIPPGLNLVANGTGKPEPVMTSQQWAVLGAAKGAAPNIQVDVYSTTTLDGQELKGVVVTEINRYDKESADGLNNGRWV